MRWTLFPVPAANAYGSTSASVTKRISGALWTDVLAQAAFGEGNGVNIGLEIETLFGLSLRVQWHNLPQPNQLKKES